VYQWAEGRDGPGRYAFPGYVAAFGVAVYGLSRLATAPARSLFALLGVVTCLLALVLVVEDYLAPT
jgi:hypothetical protein